MRGSEEGNGEGRGGGRGAGPGGERGGIGAPEASEGKGKSVMDLDLGPDIARFRAELRDWIAAEAPGGLAGLAEWRTAMTAGGRRGARLAAAQADPAYAEWAEKLLARRLICPQWPDE